MTTPTRRRVGDVYCMASRRSTTTSPKPQPDLRVQRFKATEEDNTIVFPPAESLVDHRPQN